MTSVYNSFQAYNLSRTERFLKSDECNSFQNFQHFRKRRLSFCQFCHLLANDLIVDVASPFAYDSEDSEEGNQTTTSNDKEAGKDFFLIRSGVHTSHIGISLLRERINDCHMSRVLVANK
jgi:hypothetical protein